MSERKLAKISKRLDGKMENLLRVELACEDLLLLHKAHLQLGGKLDKYLVYLLRKYPNMRLDDDYYTETEDMLVGGLLTRYKNADIDSSDGEGKDDKK